MTSPARIADAPGTNVAQKSGLNREILDVGWAMRAGILSYKCERAGGQVVTVDPRYTSQRCSGCGETVPKALSERSHRCDGCGLTVDRDVNAARNILFLALCEIHQVSPGLRGSGA